MVPSAICVRSLWTNATAGMGEKEGHIHNKIRSLKPPNCTFGVLVLVYHTPQRHQDSGSFLSAKPDTGISSEPYLPTSEFFLFSERTQHTLLKRINTFRPTFTDASRRPVRPPTTQPVLGAEYSGVRWWREGSWCGSE